MRSSTGADSADMPGEILVLDAKTSMPITTFQCAEEIRSCRMTGFAAAYAGQRGQTAMHAIVRIVCASAICLYLSACVVVDDFSSRIYSANVNSQVAIDQETFLNIVRASRFQPLTFVAISKISGQQTDTLNVGLPAFTLGPNQQPVNRLYSFANNSVSANAMGNFDSNPLISSAFQEGMMSPITQRVLALLIGSHRRELVALAAIDGIRLTDDQRRSWYFKNDPGNNLYPPAGPDPLAQDSVCKSLEPVTPDNQANEQTVTHLRIEFGLHCNYSLFVHYLRWGLDLGMTAEISRSNQAPPKLQSANVSSLTNALNSPAPPGKLCFDTSLARSTGEKYDFDYKYYSGKLRPNCRDIDRPNLGGPFSFRIAKKDYSVDVVLRSPVGIYNYLGGLIRNGTAERVMLRDENTYNEILGPIVDVGPETARCLVDLSAVAGYVCGARAERNASLDRHGRAETTLALVSMLQQLRNLMIQPVDLNSSFSVRISP